MMAIAFTLAQKKWHVLFVLYHILDNHVLSTFLTYNALQDNKLQLSSSNKFSLSFVGEEKFSHVVRRKNDLIKRFVALELVESPTIFPRKD